MEEINSTNMKRKYEVLSDIQWHDIRQDYFGGGVGGPCKRISSCIRLQMRKPTYQITPDEEGERPVGLREPEQGPAGDSLATL
jgi:hypothetical protein